MSPDDAQLLDDVLAKLREMQEQLSIAESEAEPRELLRGRIRHLYILATYVRSKLEQIAHSARMLPAPGSNASPGNPAQR